MKRTHASIAALIIAQSVLSGVVDAQPARPAPTAPAQIDATPPLIPIPGARVTADGLLVGGQPSPGQLEAIQKAGYRTVVSLMTSDERGASGERRAVERLGLTFVSIPVAGASGITEANARALSNAVDKPDARPAVVHDLDGQRASALLGLEAFVVDRVPPAVAIQLAKTLGMKRYEPALRQRIEEICKRDTSRRCEEVP